MLEFLYFYNARSAEESSGDWIKLGSAIKLTSSSSPFIFDVSSFSWPQSTVVSTFNVLLGTNGRGKSRALTSIFSSVPHGGQIAEGCALLVKRGPEILLLKDRKFNFEIEVNGFFLRTLVSDTEEIVESEGTQEISQILQNSVVAFIDPVLRAEIPSPDYLIQTGYGENFGSIDMRSNSLLNSADTRGRITSHNFKEHYFREIDRDLDFIFSNDAEILQAFAHDNSGAGMPLPEKLWFSINSSVISSFRNRHRFIAQSAKNNAHQNSFVSLHDDFSRKIQNFTVMSKNHSFRSFLNSLRLTFIISHLGHILSNNPSANEDYERFLRASENISPRESDLMLILLADVQQFPILAKRIEDRLRELEKFITMLEVHAIEDKNSWHLPIHKEQGFVRELWHAYKKSSYVSKLLNFQWRSLSGGETILLKIFSRLFSISKELRKFGTQNALILLDEPDTSLHPEWERTLIKNLILFCNQVFEGLSIQILMSTNKPFCLSDLTRDNITILGHQDSDSFAPFCNRISTVLAEGFFLKSDIGGLAEEFLSKAENGTLNQQELKLIAHIGDEFLKRAVRDILAEK